MIQMTNFSQQGADNLRVTSPTPADLARMRQLKQNSPPKGVKRGNGKEKGDPKNR